MSAKGDQIAILAREQIGKPYVWGTSGPDTFDCSGLVWWCVEQVDPSLPHSKSSYDYPRLGRAVLANMSWEPGDVLMFDTEGNAKCGHVGIYLGMGTDGKFVMSNALNERAGVVRSNPLSSYFKPILLGVRRLVPMVTTTTTTTTKPTTTTTPRPLSLEDRIKDLELRVTRLEKRPVRLRDQVTGRYLPTPSQDT